ncbi:MAG: protein kinase domain-containing protein [Spirulinaceae cyanobacterium]
MVEQTQVNHPQINEILQQRYQIKKRLAKGAFGQTYLVCDLGGKDAPYYVVKYYCQYPNYPHLRQTSQRLFQKEVENLKKLGTHDRIPQLIDYFEENNGFYLVQEWIVGQTLNDYLSVLQPLDLQEREAQVIQLIYSVLEVLDFVHRHNILHCDIKPNNLIRRDRDGEWVLIDFGATQDLQPMVSKRARAIAVSASGYLAAEHLAGMPQPSSDLYSLGVVGIEALTRCNPNQLQFSMEMGEPLFSTKGYNPLFIAVLKKMTRQNWQHRYLTTGDLLAVMKELMPLNTNVNPAIPAIDVEVIDFEILPADSPENEPEPVAAVSNALKSPEKPRLKAIAGAGVTLASLNAVAIAMGIHALSNTALADPGAQILTRAAYALDRGDFDQAISLVESISSDSILYEESQNRAQQWRKDWEIAEAQFSEIEKAHSLEDWNAVLSYARFMPKIRYWQQKTAPLRDRAQQEADRQAQNLLTQAHREARNKEFTLALKYLNQISPHTEIGATIQPKIIEYRQKQQIRARALLQNAYDRAAVRDFRAAIYFLKQIPDNTPAGEIAQRKLQEYIEKQKIKDRVAGQNPLSWQSRHDTLNPGDLVLEINL